MECCPLVVTRMWHIQIHISYDYLHKIKPVEDFSMEREEASEAPVPTEELLAIAGCCRRESYFSLGEGDPW